MTLRLPIKALVCLLVVGSISAQPGFTVGASASAEVGDPCVHPYKVALDTSTLWGNGNNTHSQMLDSAAKQGFNAIFFADDQHLLHNVGIEDPGFENVTASGGLADWANFTSGIPSVGMARVNRTITRSGSSSLEFALSGNYSDEYAIPIWGAQSHRMHLFGDVQFRASVNVVNVTLARQSITWLGWKGQIRSKLVNVTWSEAWVYFLVSVRLSPYSNSTEGGLLKIYLVYDYRYPERTKPIGENSTSTYYLSLTRPREGWNDFSLNLTSLAKELWNQTVVDYGWVDSVAVGVRSMGNSYVDALFDDVSITPVDDFASMIQYARNSIIPSLSSDGVKAYSGYSLTQQDPLTQRPLDVSILGGSAQAEDLHGAINWNPFSLEIRDNGSLLVLDSPISRGTVRNSSKIMQNLSVADLGDNQPLWDWLLTQGRAVMTAASHVPYGYAAFAVQEDFANQSAWINEVCAENNSEQSLLEAIYLGHSYVARNSFNGEFEFDSLGFEGGRLPFYVGNNTDAVLHLTITGVEGGTVHLITDHGREIVTEQLPISGEFDEIVKIPFSGNSTYFRAVITNSTGSLVALSNPIFYIREPMPQGSYVYISDPIASVQSWNMTDIFTHLEILIRLVAGEPMFSVSTNGSAIYLRPPTRESRYQITIGDVTRPADDFYDNELDGYVVPLVSELPIAITFSLDRSLIEALAVTGEQLAPLLALVALPFAVASAYLYLKAKRRKVQD
jgi:hypothetical protein